MSAAVDLPRLASTLHNLYAPAFEVLVDGEDARKRLGLDVLSVTVDSPLDAPARFTFAVGNLFDVAKRQFGGGMAALRLGATVVVRMGYRDVGTMETMIHGLVSEVTTSFPSGGLPQVTVAGFDLSYPMTKRQDSFNWDRKKDSEIVVDVAEDYGLDVDPVDTQVTHPKVEQHAETDARFLRKLAERNGYVLYVEPERTLRFAPPRLDEDEIVTLEWGKGLLSFAPEVNLAEQVSEVEVRGWDPRGKQEIVGKATAADVRGKKETGALSGADLARLLARESRVSVRRPVHSSQEATRLAQGILEGRAERFVTGAGETIGIPTLRIDRNVRILGVGRDYERAYYVEQTTHAITSAGYRTTFKVRDTALGAGGGTR